MKHFSPVERITSGFSLISLSVSQLIRSQDIKILSFNCVHEATEYLALNRTPTNNLTALAPHITTIRFHFPFCDPSAWENSEIDAETGDLETWKAFWDNFQATSLLHIKLKSLSFRFFHQNNQFALQHLSQRDLYLPASLTRLEMFPACSEDFDPDTVSHSTVPLIIS